MALSRRTRETFALKKEEKKKKRQINKNLKQTNNMGRNLSMKAPKQKLLNLSK